MTDAADPRSGELQSRILSVFLILLGAALRVLYAYPVHRFPADSDCLMAGLRAFRILDGQFPVFLMPPRIGSLECYGHALAFLLFGVSRASISLTPLVSGVLLLIVYAILSRWLLGPKVGLIALLLLAVPPSSYLFWTYMPNSYAETMLLCGVVLTIAVGMDVAGERLFGLFGLGFFAGLAWWQSFLALGCVAPVLVWYFWKHPKEIARRIALLAIAVLLGALPWIVYNAHHSLASFRGSYATTPVTRTAQVISNAAYVATGSAPELLASLEPRGGPGPFHPARKALKIVVLALYGASVVFAVARAVSARRRGTSAGDGPQRLRSPILVLSIAAAVCLMPLFSQAGSFRGLQSRYVIVLMLVAPLLAAQLLGASRRALSPWTILGLAALLSLNCSSYALPWTELRIRSAAERKASDQLVDFLRREKVEAVCGDYWLVYPINFLSRESIIGAPLNQDLDYLRYGPNLPHRPLRWALASRNAKGLQNWAARVALVGRVVSPAPDYFVFLPAENPPTGQIGPRFLGRLRVAYYLK